MATVTFSCNASTASTGCSRVYDNYMGDYLNITYTVEYNITGTSGQARGRVQLSDNTSTGTQNRYACEAYIGGQKIFENKTLKAYTSGYEQVSGDTGWSSWVNFTVTEPTNLGVICDIAQTGYSGSWNNFQNLNGSAAPARWVNTTTPVEPGMTVDGTVANGTAVGSVNYSAVATIEGQTISSYAWTIDGKTATNADGTERTMTGITPNSNISWSVTATSSGGVTASDSGTLTTKHTAPSLSGGTWTNGTRTSGKYQGTLAYNRSYNNGTAFSSHTLVYGTSTSYGTTATDPGSGTTWTLSNLNPNTTYYWKVTETDNGLIPASATLTGSFTVTGIAPTISSVSVTPDENSCAFSWTATPDTGATISSRKIEYGTSTSYGSQITPNSDSGTITSLSGATKYYYRITVTDSKGRSSTSTGNFTTLSYPPRNIVVVGEEITNNSIKISWTADVPGGAPVISTTVYVDEVPHTVVSGSTYTMSGLASDSDHIFKVSLTNSEGTTISDGTTLTTLLNAPTLTTVVTAPVFNQINIVATGSISPTRVLMYRFSNDGGATWTAEQSSSSYTFNNLTEETTYNIVTEVRALHQGTYSGDVYIYQYDTITTPADQAKVRLKTSGSWVTGKAWIKVGGVWKKAKKVYVKKNGEWVLNKNG